jgi:hypothetical protein
MGVDEARHDDPAAAIDDLRVIRRRRIAFRHGFDPIALDEQTEPVAQFGGLSVEQTKIREQNGSRWLLGRRLRMSMTEQPQRCNGRGHARNEAAP